MGKTKLPEAGLEPSRHIHQAPPLPHACVKGSGMLYFPETKPIHQKRVGNHRLRYPQIFMLNTS